MNVVIKDYSRYTITKDGCIVNQKTGFCLEGGINNSGYKQYRLTNDLGITVTWGLHRLLAWVFIAKFDNIDGLVVNHLDGDKLNNTLDNFEIVTYQENTHHAGLHGLTEKCKPISIRDVATGLVTQYPSVIAFSRECGLSKDVVSARCHKGEDYVFNDLNQYKFGWEDFKPLTINKLSAVIDTANMKPVLVRDVMTGELNEFNSSFEASKFLGVSAGYISKWLRDETQPILRGLVQIQPLKTFESWVEHDDIVANYEKTNNVRCVCVWNKFDEMEIFYSAKSASDELNITTTCMDYRLRSKGITTFKDGTRCAYYSDFQNRSPLVDNTQKDNSSN